MKFKIKDLLFEIFEQRETLDKMPQYAIKVTFLDGDYLWLSNEWGLCDTESACCYQAMIWMDKVGI